MRGSTMLVGAGVLLLLGPPTFLLVQHARVARLSERLVEQAAELAARAPERPAHADSQLEGAFFDRASLPLALLAEAKAEAGKDKPELCRAVREGKEPFSAATGECRRWLDAQRATLDDLLRATHARRGGLPLEIRFGVDDGTGKAMVVAVQLTALRVREALAAGRPEAAVGLCLDGLALSRESWITGGLLGAMMGVAGFNVLVPPCAAAIQAAPAAVRSDSAARLLKVRDGVARLGQLMLDEIPTEALPIFGALLPRSALARLPEEAKTLALKTHPVEGSARMTLLTLFPGAWATNMERMTRAADLFERPAGERLAGLRALHESAPRSLNPMARSFPDWSKFAARAERGLASLELLVAVARCSVYRQEHGRWPPPEALPGLFADLKLPPPVLHLDGDRATLARHRDFPPLEPDELSVTLGAGP